MVFIEITDERILLFYRKHPKMDFQTINLLFIDFFEKIFCQEHSITPQVGTRIKKQPHQEDYNRQYSYLLYGIGDDYTDFNSQTENIWEEPQIGINRRYNSPSIYSEISMQDTDELTKEPSASGFGYNFRRNSCSSIKTESIYDEDRSNNEEDMVVNELSPPSKTKIPQLNEDNCKNMYHKNHNNETDPQCHQQCYQQCYQQCHPQNHNNNHQNYNCDNEIENRCHQQCHQTPNKYLLSVLTKLYSNSDINTLKNNKLWSSVIVLNRQEKTPFIINNYDTETNLINDNIQELLDATKEHNCNGILISQNSDIFHKNNFQIDIYNNNIIVYIHHANYNDVYLLSAIEIIDQLSEYIKNTKCDGIPKDILYSINAEFQLFVSQKNASIDVVKECHKKIISQISEIRIPTLDKFLSTKYIANKKQGFLCELCKGFTANNLKALAAHKRGCIRKSTKLSHSTKGLDSTKEWTDIV